MAKQSDESREAVESLKKARQDIEDERDFIAKQRNLIKERGEKNSEILSDRVRLISLAVLGTCWAFIIGGTDPGAGIAAYALGTKKLLCPMLISVAALLCDLLQYAAYQLSARAYLGGTVAFDPNQQRELYRRLRKDWNPPLAERLNRAAEALFCAKLFLSSAGATLFIVIVLTAVRWR